jgi:hypothetical protein
MSELKPEFEGFQSLSQARRIRSQLVAKTTSELLSKHRALKEEKGDSPLIPIIEEILRDRRSAEN